MQAVIFAAGRGTRMQALTETSPKPLLTVRDAPILEHTLNSLPEDIDSVLVVVGYLDEMVRRAPCMRQNSRRICCVEQSELCGTYDALRRCRSKLNDAPFLVLNGDDLYARDDLAALIASTPFSMLAKRVPQPNNYSHLETNSAGQLIRIVGRSETGELKTTLTYTGGCLLDKNIFDLEPAKIENGEYSLPHTIAKHLNTHPVQVVEAEFWMPVGTPQELESANRRLEGIDK